MKTAKTESFKIRTTILDRIRKVARAERRSYQDQAELFIEDGLARFEASQPRDSKRA